MGKKKILINIKEKGWLPKFKLKFNTIGFHLNPLIHLSNDSTLSSNFHFHLIFFLLFLLIGIFEKLGQQSFPILCVGIYSTMFPQQKSQMFDSVFSCLRNFWSIYDKNAEFVGCETPL